MITTMQRSSAPTRRRSRIPIRSSPNTIHLRSPSAPSRLQQLQTDYQAKLQEEKEQKVQAFLDRQQEQQQRVYSRIVNSADSHFSSSSVKKPEDVMRFFTYKRNSQSENCVPSGSGRPPIAPQKRTDSGRNKSRPLAPLNKLQNETFIANAHFPKKPKERSGSEKSESRFVPFKPQPPAVKRDSAYRRPHPRYRNTANQYGLCDVNQNQKTTATSSKPTSFQNWQMEQNKEREARLRRHRILVQNGNVQKGPFIDQTFNNEENSGSMSDETSDNEDVFEMKSQREHDIQMEMVKKKEAELLAMIERHKMELVQMQKQRELEEKEAEAELLRQKIKSSRSTSKPERRPSTHHSRANSRASQFSDLAVNDNVVNHDTIFNRNASAKKRKSTPGSARAEPSPRPVQVTERQVRKKRKSSLEENQEFREPPPSKVEYNFEDALEEENMKPNDLNVVPCSICGRKFAEDRLSKHIKICKKSSKKKKVPTATLR